MQGKHLPGKHLPKYHNEKVIIAGQKFDSAREASRWGELRILERAGRISDLRRQIPFELIPAQRDEKGCLLEKQCRYIADFVYVQDGKTVVEDSKGFKTPEYIIKRKLMLQKYGIRIREV